MVYRTLARQSAMAVPEINIPFPKPNEFLEILSMKKRKTNDICLGFIIIGLGVYFDSWLGTIGLLPFVFRAVNWLHGLFTHREMHLNN